MAKVVIWGTGMFADLAYLYLTEDTEHAIVGFVVDAEFKDTDQFLGLPVVTPETVEAAFPPAECRMFVPMSQRENGDCRRSKYLAMKEKGYGFISYVSSRAQVFSNATVGENCFILENNIIQHYASVGDNVILWSNNHIGHHSSIGSHSFLTSQVVVSGRCSVGEHCYFGVNATVGDGIAVAERNILGAGSLVMRNTKPGQVFVEKPTALFPMSSGDVALK